MLYDMQVPSAECGPEGLRKLVAGTVRAASDWGGDQSVQALSLEEC